MTRIIDSMGVEMPGKGLRGLFGRKAKEDRAEEEKSKPQKNEGRDLSMQYVSSPSALDYPGVKSKEKRPDAQNVQETKPIETETNIKDKGALPRCSQCGWAIGFEDTVCVNCGYKLR